MNPVNKYIEQLKYYFSVDFVVGERFDENYGKYISIQGTSGDLGFEHLFERLEKAKPELCVTSNLSIWAKILLFKIKSGLNFELKYIPFGVDDVFSKTKKLKERRRALYYHGRIVEGKLPINSLDKLVNEVYKLKIPVVLRGPIYKNYWTNYDINSDEAKEYKYKLEVIKDIYYPYLEVYPEIEYSNQNRSEIISNELNQYKYYFTLSYSESFNLGLQEAMACGTIPVVLYNGAYNWADTAILKSFSLKNLINNVVSILKNEEKFEDKLESYSDKLAFFTKKRFSLDSIKKVSNSVDWYTASDSEYTETYEESIFNDYVKSFGLKVVFPTFFDVATKNKYLQIKPIDNMDKFYKFIKSNAALEFLKKKNEIDKKYAPAIGMPMINNEGFFYKFDLDIGYDVKNINDDKSKFATMVKATDVYNIYKNFIFDFVEDYKNFT